MDELVFLFCDNNRDPDIGLSADDSTVLTLGLLVECEPFQGHLARQVIIGMHALAYQQGPNGAAYHQMHVSGKNSKL